MSSGQLLKPLVFTCAVGGSSCVISSCYYKYRPSHNARLPYRRSNNKILQWWRNRSFSDRFFMTIASLNGIVWLSWKSKRLQPFLLRHFITSPSKTSSVYSLLFSSFSHLEVWHLAINMTVLWSFMHPFVSIIGEEWVWPYYLTSGTFASMCGHYFKLTRRSIVAIPSLGASGALLSVACLVILNNPNSMLYIIFLPFIPIPAYMGFTGVVCFDILGMIRGWRVFDHAAHLGGTLFASLYQGITYKRSS